MKGANADGGVRRRRLGYAALVLCRIDTTTKNLVRTGIFPLGEQYSLTAYDAGYLELAIREGLPLATLDDDLRKAAGVAGAFLILPPP
jgi:predicted nucleic acid-binding protein